jgi:hypothetical protein
LVATRLHRRRDRDWPREKAEFVTFAGVRRRFGNRTFDTAWTISAQTAAGFANQREQAAGGPVRQANAATAKRCRSGSPVLIHEYRACS